MSDRIKVWQTDIGLRVEHVVDAQVRVRGCAWKEDSGPAWHGFRGDFGAEPMRDAKGQLRPSGRGGDIVDRLEDFVEKRGTLEELLVWLVPA